MDVPPLVEVEAHRLREEDLLVHQSLDQRLALRRFEVPSEDVLLPRHGACDPRGVDHEFLAIGDVPVNGQGEEAAAEQEHQPGHETAGHAPAHRAAPSTRMS